MKKLKNYINGKTKENLKLNQSGRVWECATPATLIVQLAIQQNFRELSSEITIVSIKTKNCNYFQAPLVSLQFSYPFNIRLCFMLERCRQILKMFSFSKTKYKIPYLFAFVKRFLPFLKICQKSFILSLQFNIVHFENFQNFANVSRTRFGTSVFPRRQCSARYA